MIAKAEKKKCLHCDNQAWCRGLCTTCLRAARRTIKRNEATEESLIEEGLILPRANGKPDRSGFTKKFRALAAVFTFDSHHDFGDHHE